MMGESQIRLRQHRVGETGLAYDDHRFEVMSQLAQLPFLLCC